MHARYLLLLANLILVAPAFAADTICRGKGGEFISACGSCPSGTALKSGPNVPNGKPCEGDPTAISRQPISTEQAWAENKPARPRSRYEPTYPAEAQTWARSKQAKKARSASSGYRDY